MKNKILITTLLSGAVLGLSACGGGGGGTPAFNTFDGKWQSVCSNGNNNSFDQEVTINGSDVTSKINIYVGQLNCQATAIPASASATFVYKGEVDVPAGCDTGKAEKVDASIVSVTTLGQTLTNEAAIRAQLASLGIDVVPEFNLLCLGNGKLLSGDISGTNDGSTDALRPDSMDLSGFTKI